MKDEIRVGLIGYGLGGAVFHGPLIAATAGMRLAAVVTRDPARSAQALVDHPGAVVLPTADMLWELAPRLDLVVVASPNRTHAPLAHAALEAGLDVVIDKPLATSAAEGRALVEDARRRGRMLTVFQNRRWDGDFLTVRRLLTGGELGDVVRMEVRSDRWRLVPRAGWKQNPAPEEAGGLLFDLGSHLIDQALLLFGPVSDVYAELDRRRPESQVDDDTFVALAHASGVRSHLWMSTVAAQPGARFRVMGTRAAYVKHGADPQEEALRAGGRPTDPDWGAEPRERWGLLGAADDLRPVPTEPGAYHHFYKAVAAALRDGTPPPVDPMDAVRTLEIIERAREEGQGNTEQRTT
ncbi:MAG: Gfo/Idh/MocA family oxidoreductase [Gemmatimonadetes bacterium]|nr:Gfo/Idh/MocA family oxidoreductase [Gemmatimonadota bacterium]